MPSLFPSRTPLAAVLLGAALVPTVSAAQQAAPPSSAPQAPPVQAPQVQASPVQAPPPPTWTTAPPPPPTWTAPPPPPTGYATPPPSGYATPPPTAPQPYPTAPRPVMVPEYPAASPAPPPMQKVWYGWQTLITDGAALAVLTAANTSAQQGNSAEGIAALAGATFLLGGPIVHWANGQTGRGFASLGIRAGTPVAGFLILADGIENRSVFRAGLGVSLLIAWIPGAIAIDAAVLARKEVPASRVSVAPLVAPTRGGGTFGLGGTF